MKLKMQKISANFKVQLAGIGSCERRDAIVIYQPTDSAQAIGHKSRVRMNFDQKKKYLHEFASLQAPMQFNSLSTYMQEGKTRLPKDDHRDLIAKSIGQVAGALPFAHVQVTKRTLSALRRADEVLAVIPNQPINLIKPRAIDHGTLIHAERSSGMTWGLERLNIPELWSRSGTRGENIRVAVLDTGVYDQHPALIGKVSEFVVIDPLGNRVNTARRFDAGNHGTHVCGTVAGDQDPDGVRIGVAPAANLLVGAVLLGNATLLTLIEGIAWAVQQGADIISMSLGFSYYEPQFELIFKQLQSLYGILSIVAIGNECHGNSSSPGNVHAALSVGATKKVSKTSSEVAFFSSGASLAFPDEPQETYAKPDVTAPGVRVYSCIPPQQTYAYMDGSSMATPHVAGVAAVLMSAKPNAGAEDIATALRDTAHNPNGKNRRPDNRWGWGEIRPTDAWSQL